MTSHRVVGRAGLVLSILMCGCTSRAQLLVSRTAGGAAATTPAGLTTADTHPTDPRPADTRSANQGGRSSSVRGDVTTKAEGGLTFAEQLVANQKRRLALSQCKLFASMLKNYSLTNADQYPATGGYPAEEGDLSFLVPAGMVSELPNDPWGKHTYRWRITKDPATGDYSPVVWCESPTKERISSDSP